MIGNPNQHYEADELQQLLDERLTLAKSRQVESHLAGCQRCRQQLERIAGDDSWWTETVDVLAQRAHPVCQSDPADAFALDCSIDWVRPLLDDCDQGALGRIDRYPIDQVVGQGGMGVVLRGTDLELSRPVAIKVLSPHLAGVGAARARFMREAQAAASIVHPAIVPIYGVITDARLPYLVMPYLRGGNLQQRIDREGPIGLQELLRIGMQIAEGLAAAHRSGVIHRDIKPSNILIEAGNGRVLISDFGVARALDDATLTVSGIISGTPQYMSPEQARGDAIDSRSDLFSLGSLLYTLATGRPPFRAETPLGVLRKVTESAPKLISEINEQMPPWLDRLIDKLMQADVDRRIESAESAAELLRAAHAHVCNPAQHELPKSLCPVVRRQSLGSLGVLIAALLAGVVVTANLGGETNHDTARMDDQTLQTARSLPAAVAAETTELSWDHEQVSVELSRIHNEIDELESAIGAKLPELRVNTIR